MEICLIIIGPAPHNDFVKLTEYGESALGKFVLTERPSIFFWPPGNVSDWNLADSEKRNTLRGFSLK